MSGGPWIALVSHLYMKTVDSKHIPSVCCPQNTLESNESG